MEQLKKVEVVLQVNQGGDILGPEGRVTALNESLEIIGRDL